jgi:hypothetical protein
LFILFNLENSDLSNYQHKYFQGDDSEIIIPEFIYYSHVKNLSMNTLQENGIFIDENKPLIYNFGTNDMPINCLYI